MSKSGHRAKEPRGCSQRQREMLIFCVDDYVLLVQYSGGAAKVNRMTPVGRTQVPRVTKSQKMRSRGSK
jgi:hypothetical protein